MSVVIRRKRLPDGTLGELEKIFGGTTSEEQVELLGTMLIQERVNGMQKDASIAQLGQELIKMKLEIMLLKGGAE